jgi:cytochrome c-type biogenesis protein CcsB
MDLVTLQNSLDNISFAVLFFTMLIYWVGAAFPSIPYLSALGTTGMAIANLCIATLLGARWIEAGYFPLSNLYESLFFLTWGITTVHLLAENMSRSRLVGVATSPVAMGITAFAALTLPSGMQVSEPVGSLLAIAFLIVTRGQNVELRGSSVGNGGYRSKDGTITLRQYKESTQEPQLAVNNGSKVALFAQNNGSLKTALLDAATTSESSVSETSAQILSPVRLNLADTLDNISYRIIGLGFPLLTIGIIAGAVWANEAWGSYWSWDPKETWALITWLVFAAYLHARITRGWQGRKPAILAATGFVVVWICYLGVNLLGKGLHSYGWFF